MASFRYKNIVVPDFDSLVDQPFDLKSPCRSTVPLLAYWADTDNRLADLSQALGLTLSMDANLTFEDETPVRLGSEGASCTDLLIDVKVTAIAIEAKYTEPHYELVSGWLRTARAENRLSVLTGWLDVINAATDSQLTVDAVQDITYQLIHRTASVCRRRAKHLRVVYQCFFLEQRGSYAEQLTKFSSLIGPSQRLHFYLLETPIIESDAYRTLRLQWETDKSRDFTTEIRTLLKARKIANFGPVRVRKV
jgi:hypothetical protein